MSQTFYPVQPMKGHDQLHVGMKLVVMDEFPEAVRLMRCRRYMDVESNSFIECAAGDTWT